MGKDLKELLREWQAPDVPPEADERVAATFARLSRRGRSRWAGSVRLPVPVLAFLLVLQLVSAGVILRGSFFPATPVTLAPERVVEAPVIREKVVTRLVYVPMADSDAFGRRALYSAVDNESERTPMDLTGFQPVSQFQIHVVKGENRNER
jgi:hypothetical protein